ncbi:uncharacterized protein LOC111627206 [Centruroides sculpturatus]|uniref:uncharacterized protein LOC111627206 n=1 Tax=Centruroides sculpturatus TaxID=218467 RepID=UPI000C6DED3E|nr:uncharacterized protein LOC111627206 [Centruroides sculpturatus]
MGAKTKLARKLNLVKPKTSNYDFDNLNEHFAIQIENLTKRFKKFEAVKKVNITVSPGAIHGFIGPNGAGKTTTIKCLISAMLPTEGKLLIQGLKADRIEAKKLVGYIPESARFPKRISAQDYLYSMALVSGLKKREARKIAQETLQNLGLWEFRRRDPNSYSSGMKKKVLLAQSLLNNPSVLILDEPAANLDPTARSELFEDLKKLAQQGKSIFISSHVLAELQQLINEVTILNRGQVVYSSKLSDQPTNNYLISSDNQSKLLTLLRKHKVKAQQQNDKIIVTVKERADLAKAEQEIFAQIAEHNAADKYPVLTEEQIELVTHAYYLSETLRVSEKQGYLVLFTGTTVAGSYDTAAQTDVMPLFTIGSLIQTHISLYLDESQYQNYRDQVSKKRIMKYLNVIDHLPFLWRNMLENSNYDSLAGPNSALQLTDNPRVVEHFYLQDDQEGKKVYRIDLDKLESAPQIVNYWVILGFYCVLGVGLLFLNWYLFKKHDFA